MQLLQSPSVRTPFKTGDDVRSSSLLGQTCLETIRQQKSLDRSSCLRQTRSDSKATTFPHHDFHCRTCREGYLHLIPKTVWLDLHSIA